MTLSHYMESLLSKFTDTRVVRNITSLVQNIIEHTSIRLWSISQDKAEFERSRRLLNGSLQSGLDEESVSEALRSVGSQQIQTRFKTSPPELVVLLHEPCDIRKEYAEELEHLGTVRSLDGKLISGYQTFNPVLVTEQGTSPQPLATTVYSNGDPHYVTEEELKRYHKVKQLDPEREPERERHKEIEQFLSEGSAVNLKQLLRTHGTQVVQQMQFQFPDVRRCHILDRQFDGEPYFDFLGQELGDWFVIRLKLSRNSNSIQVDEATGNTQALKLNAVAFAHRHRYGISTIRLHHTTYQNVTCQVEWDRLRLSKTAYTVVRVTLHDRKGHPIFAEPMLLITNMPVVKADAACRTYRLYLLRAKIEGVFKFCKTVLGWEAFQVRDYDSIRRLLTLAYFVAGYFYASDSELIENPTIALICALGGGKGVLSRYFFLKGLQKLLVYQTVLQFMLEHHVEQRTFWEMMDFVT